MDEHTALHGDYMLVHSKGFIYRPLPMSLPDILIVAHADSAVA